MTCSRKPDQMRGDPLAIGPRPRQFERVDGGRLRIRERAPITRRSGVDSFRGKKNVRDYLRKRFKDIPDMGWHHEYHYVCGDRAVSVWVVAGKSANGEDPTYQGCDLWEFKDGKVCNKDTYGKTIDRDYWARWRRGGGSARTEAVLRRRR